MRKRILSFGLFLFIFSSTGLFAQVNFGADFMSRYIWRGTDFGNSPSIQPALSFAKSGFEIGAWAAYPTSAESAAADEHDLWASYGFETPSGDIAITVTDYYYPNAGKQFFSFDGDGVGAHVLEASVSFSGPISLMAAFNFHNDDDNSIYVEAGFSREIEGTAVDFFAGLATGESAWYGTEDASLINVGVTASKDVKITDKFSLPLSASFILNPDIEKTYLVFGFSL